MSSVDKMISSQKKLSPNALVSPGKKSSSVEYDTSKTLKSVSHSAKVGKFSAFVKKSFDSKTPSNNVAVGGLLELHKVFFEGHKFGGKVRVNAFKAKKYELEIPSYTGCQKTVTRKIIDNSSAKDVRYDELFEFIKHNSAFARKFVDNKFVCADFAELLHNRAETNGIRCAYALMLNRDYRTNTTGHATCVFYTPDKGAVFVDLTCGKIYDESAFLEELAPKYIEIDILC
jgi:hypothetical protein